MGALTFWGSAAPVVARQTAQSPDLTKLLSALQLTGAGVATWLDRLAPTTQEGSRTNAPERLLAVMADGSLVEAIDGGPSRVLMSSSLDDRLSRPGAGIVLVHNHPSGNGFSAEDLDQLGNPGVLAVVAVGHDGSVYAAAVGPKYPVDRFARVYASVRGEADREMRQSASRVTGDSLVAFLPHVIALALAEVGVIKYRVTLGADRQVAYDRDRVLLGRVTAVAKHSADVALKALAKVHE